MRPYIHWALYLAGGIALGCLTGWMLGLLIQRLMLDYASPVAPFVAKGWRTGLVAGSLVALGALSGRRTRASLLAGMLHLALALAGAVLASGLAGAAAYLLSAARVLQLPDAALEQVGNPNRVFACSGLSWGAAVGALLFASAASLLLRRARTTGPAPI